MMQLRFNPRGSLPLYVDGSWRGEKHYGACVVWSADGVALAASTPVRGGYSVTRGSNRAFRVDESALPVSHLHRLRGEFANISSQDFAHHSSADHRKERKRLLVSRILLFWCMYYSWRFWHLLGFIELRRSYNVWSARTLRTDAWFCQILKSSHRTIPPSRILDDRGMKNVPQIHLCCRSSKNIKSLILRFSFELVKIVPVSVLKN